MTRPLFRPDSLAAVNRCDLNSRHLRVRGEILTGQPVGIWRSWIAAAPGSGSRERGEMARKCGKTRTAERFALGGSRQLVCPIGSL